LVENSVNTERDINKY